MQEDPKYIKNLIEGCVSGKREAHKEFYMLFHAYAMSICLRYSSCREDAVEIMNDGFFKVFKYLQKFDQSRPLKPWLRKIMVNSALDHMKKFEQKLEEKYIDDQIKDLIGQSEPGIVSYEDILDMVRLLSPAYRTVFNLHAIEGYKHAEIATMLGITEGTVKSNYFKAKKKLQELLSIHFDLNA